MSALITIVIFVLVLIFYIHITHHYKKSEDLEIYETDYTNKTHINEVCNLKQPVLFEFKSICPEIYEKINKETMEEYYEDLEMNVKDTDEYLDEDRDKSGVILSYKSLNRLIESDQKGHIISESNSDAIEENKELYNVFFNANPYLKPDFTIQTKYDILVGSSNAYTPLKYHTNYRHFISVITGKLHVKMTPWKSSKYLNPVKDMENYEFRSPYDVWNPNEKHKSITEKIKFVEFDIYPNYCLYVPPYWWYSIKYSNDNDNFACGITYNSIMSTLSNLPDIILYYMQQHNITQKIIAPPKDETSDSIDSIII